MDRQTHIEKIRAACARANPEAFKSGNLPYRKEVTIVDVLLAIREATKSDYGYFVQDDGELRQTHTGKGTNWNFYQDDLTHQSDETIKFLADLLV